MRKLALKDAFSLARIVKAADVKKEMVSFAAEMRGKKAEDIEAVGLEFFVTLIQAASDVNVENKVYALYADLKGATAEEVSNYDLATVKADIKELIAENDLKSFFSSFSALMSKQ
jgi:hypothetical protein